MLSKRERKAFEILRGQVKALRSRLRESIQRNNELSDLLELTKSKGVAKAEEKK